MPIFNNSEVQAPISPSVHAAANLVQRSSFTVFLIISVAASALLFSQYHTLSSAYAYVTHEGMVYTHIYSLAAGSAFVTFVIATCHRSRIIKNIRDSILNTTSSILDNFRHLVFKSAFFYGNSIDELTNSSSFVKKHLLSRIAAAGISLFSALQLAQDIQHVACHSVNGVLSCVTKAQSPLRYPSNYRNVALITGEIGTHIIGACFGSLIGLVSPQTARKWFLPSNQTFMETRKENMTAQEAGILYGMFSIIDELFAENNIQYAMTAGTVLGKERHGGIIPWDDDIDLFILEKDEAAFLALGEQLSAYDLAIIPCRIGYKIYWTKGHNVQEGSLNYKYPFIDIAIAQEREGKIVYRDEHSRQTYAGEYYTREEWNKLTRVKFGPIEVNGLEDGLAFVKRCYGETAMDYGFTLLNHRTFGLEFPKKYFLHKNDHSNPQASKCRPIRYDEESFRTFANQNIV